MLMLAKIGATPLAQNSAKWGGKGVSAVPQRQSWLLLLLLLGKQ
jgi:hypothetical protein